MVERCHYQAWDYFYSLEIQKGNEWAKSKNWDGYHNIKRIIEQSEVHTNFGYLTIRDFVAGKSGTSPLVVADSLEKNANAALTLAASLSIISNRLFHVEKFLTLVK